MEEVLDDMDEQGGSMKYTKIDDMKYDDGANQEKESFMRTMKRCIIDGGRQNHCCHFNGGFCGYDPSLCELTVEQFKKVQDSGQMEDFDTGSVRDTRDGKGRFDLITPIAMKRIAQHYENGAKKYKDRNWEKGQPVSRFFDSATRHLNTLMELKLKGKPLDEDHLAAAIWNLMAIIHVEDMVAEGLLPLHLVDWPKPMRPAIKGVHFEEDTQTN